MKMPERMLPKKVQMKLNEEKKKRQNRDGNKNDAN